ncbi:hypothetical protein AB0K23_29785 [Streptomyces sp. NPDC049602]|uniref:hypothetical protein n=1 Tax=Streptomyces sp. NPDC049602 TaxID=3155504 RepID=UPI00343F7CE4
MKVTSRTQLQGAAYAITFAAIAIAIAIAIARPNFTLKEHGSPYRFTEAPVGPYAAKP